MQFWSAKAKEKHNVEILWDRQVLHFLSDGYNVYYGARSIKHEVERRVVTQLALAHETGQLTKGASVKILVDNFGDEATLPKLKLSIRKTAQEDFVELYDEVFSNDSPLSDH